MKAAGHDAHAGKCLLPYLERAAKLFPLSENVQLTCIEALYEFEGPHAALTRYADVVEWFCEVLAERPDNTGFTDLYKRISGGLQSPLEAVSEFRDSAVGSAEQAGALYCLSETFKSVVDAARRDAARSGRPVVLMLCTARERRADVANAEARQKKVSAALKRAIGESLRRSDAFTRYSANQFMIMLTGTDCDSCRLIAERLRRSFSKLPGVSGVRLEFDYVVA